MLARFCDSCAPGGNRTPNLGVRSALLYPIELLEPHLIIPGHSFGYSGMFIKDAVCNIRAAGSVG